MDMRLIGLHYTGSTFLDLDQGLLVDPDYILSCAKPLEPIHHEENSYAGAKQCALLSQLGQGAAG